MNFKCDYCVLLHKLKIEGASTLSAADDSVLIAPFAGTKWERMYHEYYRKKGMHMEDVNDVEAVIVFNERFCGTGGSKGDLDGLIYSILATALRFPPYYIGFWEFHEDKVWSTHDIDIDSSEYTQFFDMDGHEKLIVLQQDKIKILQYYFKQWHDLYIKTGSRYSTERVLRAMSLLGTACTQKILENAIIIMSVVLETLLAPINDRELTHQLAVNYAGIDVNKENRLIRYERFRKFYNGRSKLVHGGKTDNHEKILELLLLGYDLSGDVFEKIATIPGLHEILNDDARRKTFFKNIALGL